MEFHRVTVTFLFLSFSTFIIFFLALRKKKSKNEYPPGPPGLPILGNLFDLGTIPHQTLHELRPKYGPLIWLKIGSVNTLVVQSAKVAAELFKNHDLTFSDRTCVHALTAHNYNQGSLAVGQYGPYWRALRRLCAGELLSTKRINESTHLRRHCVDNMINYITQDSLATRERGESGALTLADYLMAMSFNVVGNLMLSRDLLGSNSQAGRKFFDALNKMGPGSGKPNLSDFFPFFKRFDPQGIKKAMERDMGQILGIVEGFLKERVEDQEKFGEGRERKRDFLDALLEFEGDGKEFPSKISNHNITIIVLEMFMAGSETTSSTIEWTITELFRKPESMKKVKEELNRVVGTKRKVEESDIEELVYLQAVMKETLRLHPPLPLLLPRNTLQDTNFMGYLVPKNTQVFVNAWAIGRDPDSWKNPLSFDPERFLSSSDIDTKGHNFELLPFRSGRRVCVGMTLAHRVLHLGVASLLHCFDWELDTNLTPQDINMSERMGLSVRKLVPLRVIPKKRIDV